MEGRPIEENKSMGFAKKGGDKERNFADVTTNLKRTLICGSTVGADEDEGYQ